MCSKLCSYNTSSVILIYSQLFSAGSYLFFGLYQKSSFTKKSSYAPDQKPVTKNPGAAYVLVLPVILCN